MLLQEYVAHELKEKVPEGWEEAVYDFVQNGGLEEEERANTHEGDKESGAGCDSPETGAWGEQSATDQSAEPLYGGPVVIGNGEAVADTGSSEDEDEDDT